MAAIERRGMISYAAADAGFDTASLWTCLTYSVPVVLSLTLARLSTPLDLEAPIKAAPALDPVGQPPRQICAVLDRCPQLFSNRRISAANSLGERRCSRCEPSAIVKPSCISTMRVRLNTEYADQIRTRQEHLLRTAGNPSLMTDGLKTTLVEHAAGNDRVLATLAAELFDTAAQKQQENLDKATKPGELLPRAFAENNH